MALAICFITLILLAGAFVYWTDFAYFNVVILTAIALYLAYRGYFSSDKKDTTK